MNYEDGFKKVGIDSLEDRRINLCMKFAKNCLKNEKTEKMFPLRKKVHQMDNRYEEKFKVNFAKTERLKKSSIPYMQSELNSENKKNQKKLRNPG